MLVTLLPAVYRGRILDCLQECHKAPLFFSDRRAHCISSGSFWVILVVFNPPIILCCLVFHRWSIVPIELLEFVQSRFKFSFCLIYLRVSSFPVFDYNQLFLSVVPSVLLCSCHNYVSHRSSGVNERFCLSLSLAYLFSCLTGKWPEKRWFQRLGSIWWELLHLFVCLFVFVSCGR